MTGNNWEDPVAKAKSELSSQEKASDHEIVRYREGDRAEKICF